MTLENPMLARLTIILATAAVLLVLLSITRWRRYRHGAEAARTPSYASITRTNPTPYEFHALGYRPPPPPNPPPRRDSLAIPDGQMDQYAMERMREVVTRLERGGNLEAAEEGLRAYIEECRISRMPVNQNAVHVWSAAIQQARARQQQSVNYMIQGGTVYGQQVINQEEIERFGIQFVAADVNDPARVLLKIGNNQFFATRISDTTLQVDTVPLTARSIEQVGKMLAEAQESHRLPPRDRTVMWEKDDERA